MSEEKSSKKTKVSLKGGVPIPCMQPIETGGNEKKGAPIPNMQPVSDGQTQTDDEASTEAQQTNQTNNEQEKK